MQTAQNISLHIISFFDSKGDVITNKKLQKLLYYIDAWHLVYFDVPIIAEDFEAWVHGPVVPDVYRYFKKFGYEQIALDYKSVKSASEFNTEHLMKLKINTDSLDLIESVLLKYGALSSFKLEFLSHSEEPWLKAREGYDVIDKCSVTIDKNLMKSFYTNLLNGKS